MRILITGRNGQIGWELERTLAPLGETFAFDRAQLDLQNFDALRSTVRTVGPQVIVNAAAYTAVDKAESERELAHRINGEAPGVLAEEAKRLGALLVHYSTDYVFDGTKPDPYTEEDQPNPINEYGHSKLKGEQAVRSSGARHLIFRTSWIYAARGKNFLLTMLRLARERSELRVVDDQYGSPTWARMVAEATAAMLARQASNLRGVGPHDDQETGLFHLCASGQTSWHGFAEAILRESGYRRQGPAPSLTSIKTSEYPTAARRPPSSVLCCEKVERTFGVRLPTWQRMLAYCLADARESSVDKNALSSPNG